MRTDYKTLDLGVHQVLPSNTLSHIVESSTRPLRIKMGFDPTKPDIHLGHYVGLRKLRELQDFGNEVIIIIGDFTALIGDPSGRDSTRPEMSVVQIGRNTKTYIDQIEKILDPGKTTIKYQREWFSSITLRSVLDLLKTVSVNQLLHRDDFRNRMNNNSSITMTELLYPILQGYDSFMVMADIELGGTDQTFNLLMGRAIQKALGQKEQVCITLPILTGIDGEKKMSKSYDNYIGITESPMDMYRKTMQIPDSLIPEWRNLVGDDRVGINGSNLTLKRELARNIVSKFHGIKAADETSLEWKNQNPTFWIPKPEIDKVGFAQALVNHNVVPSKTKFKKLNIEIPPIEVGTEIKISKHKVVLVTNE